MTTATLIVQYLGAGLAANRPATPAVDTGALAIYLATDTGVQSLYYSGAWHNLSANDPTISPWLSNATPGWDTQFIGTAITFTNSNKRATPGSSSPFNYMYGNIANYTGKKYLEFVPASASFESVGFAGPRGHLVDNGAGSPGNLGTLVPAQVGWDSSGAVKACGVKEGAVATLSTIATWAGGNTLCAALDIDNALLWLRVGAGNWNNNVSANPATGALGISVPHLFGGGPRLVWPAANAGNTSATDLFLKTADFTGAVPSGFSSWSGL